MFSEQLKQFNSFLLLDKGLQQITREGHITSIKVVLKRIETENPNHSELREHLLWMHSKEYSHSHITNTSKAIEYFTEFKNNPLKIARTRRPKKIITDTLTEAEVNAMIRNTKDIREKSIVSLLAFSGIRNKEFCNLKVEDIDFGANQIIIRNGKYSKDRRANIGSSCTNILIEYIMEYKKQKEDFLFTTIQKNNQYKTGDLRKFIRVLAKRTRIEKRVFPHLFRHCVSEDTQILTSSGWKYYHEIKIGELIPTLDMESNIIEFTPIKNIHKYNHNGEIYNIKNRFIDCILTPEHKMVIKRAIEKQKGSYDNKKRWTKWLNWELISVNDLLKVPNKRLIKHRISGIINDKGLSIGKPKAGLLGWILTDAVIQKRKSRKDYEIVISQSYSANKKKCERIKKLLKDSGLKHSVILEKPKKTGFSENSQMMNFRIFSENNKWILDWINEDRTPKWKLLQLKKEELQELYENIMLGDGSRGHELSTQNKKRIDFFRALCSLIGKRTRLGKGELTLRKGEKYRTYVTNKDNCNLLKSHINKINYKGIVWCPETKNKTFIAKRNETIFITGNSLATNLLKRGANIFLIMEQLGHSDINTTCHYIKTLPYRIKNEYDYYIPAYI